MRLFALSEMKNHTYGPYQKKKKSHLCCAPNPNKHHERLFVQLIVVVQQLARKEDVLYRCMLRSFPFLGFHHPTPVGQQFSPSARFPGKENFRKGRANHGYSRGSLMLSPHKSLLNSWTDED